MSEDIKQTSEKELHECKSLLIFSIIFEVLCFGYRMRGISASHPQNVCRFQLPVHEGSMQLTAACDSTCIRKRFHSEGCSHFC